MAATAALGTGVTDGGTLEDFSQFAAILLSARLQIRRYSEDLVPFLPQVHGGRRSHWRRRTGIDH